MRLAALSIIMSFLRAVACISCGSFRENSCRKIRACSGSAKLLIIIALYTRNRHKSSSLGICGDERLELLDEGLGGGELGGEVGLSGLGLRIEE